MIPDFFEELRLISTPAGAIQEGGGQCHTLGHPCRAGGITADRRRCVIISEDQFEFTVSRFINTSSKIAADGVNSPNRVAPVEVYA